MFKEIPFDEIINCIRKRKEIEKIVLFGSRARDDFKESSDIDIAVFGKSWTDTDINITKDELEQNINIPLKFDLINYYSIKKGALKERICQEGRVIYESVKNP